MTVIAYLSQQVKLLRVSRGWSQAHLGMLAGIPQVTVCHLERGERKEVNIQAVRRIARAFQVSIDELVGTNKADLEDSRRVVHY